MTIVNDISAKNDIFLETFLRMIAKTEMSLIIYV
jgi:hypothetical protein